MRKKINLLFVAVFVFFGTNIFAQDAKFHIYLCLGQSNMEGNAKFEPQDTVVDKRFKVLEAVDCDNLNRKRENGILLFHL